MNKDIREEFWHAMEKSPIVMIKLEGGSGHAEPMTTQLDKDAHHTVWFYARRTNRIASGGKAMAQFASKGHDVFACIDGTLVEETDASRKAKHWDNAAEAWFPGGKDDPSLIMLRFEINDAEVWTADPGIVGTFKLLTGSKIKAEQAGEHAVGLV
jgi:general stress protein 26